MKHTPNYETNVAPARAAAIDGAVDRMLPAVVLGQGTSRTEWPQRSPAEVREDRARIDAEMARNAENIHAITNRFKREADAMCSRLTREWAHADLARALEKYLAAYPTLDADTPQIEAAQRLQRLLNGGVL